MKYKFEKIDDDTTKLTYKDKEITITKDVDLIKRLQEINVRARKKMIMELAKEGLNIKNLVIETKKDGKTYYDNSNVDELEQAYIQEQTIIVFDEIAKKYTGMELASLITDVGLNEEMEITKFSEEFTKALIGTPTPR